MLGSCCEEQEAQEAAVRSRIRAATRMSEGRLFGNSLAAARAQGFCKRPFHEGACGEGLCGAECGDCDEDEDEDEANDDPAESDPRMAHDDDDEEAELLRRLRATRLAALRSAAEKAARPAVKYEYVEERALLLLLDDPAAPPTVCLVGCGEDTELSVWIDDHLTAVAPRHPSARFVRAQDCETLLNGLPRIRSLPALLLLHCGIVLAYDQGLDEEREPEALRERIDGWLREHGAKLAHQPPATHSDSEEDEEGDGTSYCGRAGCRDYPHEHVAWKEKKPAEKRVVPRELRQL